MLHPEQGVILEHPRFAAVGVDFEAGRVGLQHVAQLTTVAQGDAQEHVGLAGGDAFDAHRFAGEALRAADLPAGADACAFFLHLGIALPFTLDRQHRPQLAALHPHGRLLPAHLRQVLRDLLDLEQRGRKLVGDSGRCQGQQHQKQ